jgi:uncharacterized iron-regulated protein
MTALTLAPICLAAMTLSVDPTPNPTLLSIGRSGQTKVAVNKVTDLGSGKTATIADIVKASEGKKWLYLGEQHATPAHQAMQADVVRALAASGRKVVVGVEFIQRPKQSVLDEWVAGNLTEDAFLEQVEWKAQWGFEYRHYKPIFDIAKEKSIPMIGLNVPRAWVRTTSREGFDKLPVEARQQLPAKLDLDVKEHREMFMAMMGGHPMEGNLATNMYAAQVLWDEAMADTAIKYRAANPDTADAIFVILAGWGHIGYGQGINLRVQKRTGESGPSIVMLESASDMPVANGIADFVFLSKKPEVSGLTTQSAGS